MTETIEVSAIIPTWNRRDLVCRAIDSVLAQSQRVDEIIVIDDGSIDGTGDLLTRTYGDRICYVRQDNAGVSAARNHGLRLARGRYLALLDSDDVWLPEKTHRQWQWLEAHPDFGMVLCDVERVTETGEPIDVLRRSEQLPADGNALACVLRDPALVPASVFMRRIVFEDVGGFDESLRTAEDLDYHIRIARRWKIGSLHESLVRAVRGHVGLSTLDQTYDDYLNVLAPAIEAATGLVSAKDLRHARFNMGMRAARGRIYQRRWFEALRYARLAYANAENRDQRRKVFALAPMAVRHRLSTLLKRSR
jgi:glycosyltransferase involved in cell wall biosynthesis